MRSKTKLIFLGAVLMGFFAWAQSSQAADFYITQNISGADTGADCANAHAVNWFNVTDNWANPKVAGKIGPGDTVHLCGIISNPLTIQGSGSLEDPIILLWEEGSKISMDRFTGTTDDATVKAAIYSAGSNYIVLDGGTNGIIEATDNGTDKTYQVNCVGVRVGSKVLGWEIKNLHIGPVYERIADSTDSNAFGVGISFKFGGNGIRVNNNTIDHSKAGIGFYGGSNENISGISIYNNTLTNISEGVSVGQSQLAAHSGSIDNVNIYNNAINGGNWDGDWGDHHHHGGIHCYGGPLTATFTRLNIYNNIIGPNMGASIGYLTAGIYLEYNITSPNIYNNIISAVAPGAPTNGFIAVKGSAGITPVASNAKVYNNTIVLTGIAGGSCIYGYDISGFDIQNNICYGVGNGIDTGGGVTFADVNHNIYYPTVQFRYNGVSGYSWEQWRGIAPNPPDFDAESFNNTDPMVDANYMPTASSPAIGNGAVLPGTFSVDYVGALRPQGGAWDIGAYEFTGSDIVAPSAPSGLDVT